MLLDELRNIAAGLISYLDRSKLQRKLKDTARHALDESIKNIELEKKIKDLQDEVRRLKGEKPKPKIKPVSSSDLKENEKKEHKKSSKKDSLEIDSTFEIDFEKKDLPSDAKYVGMREVIIQEIILKRNNTCFMIKRYYSKSLGRVYEGEVPEEYRGSEFGPSLRSFILYQYYKNRVPHEKIRLMLLDLGISIAKGTICFLLNNQMDDFKDDLLSAKSSGLKKCSYAHFDDTGAKLTGVNYHTFVLGNPYFTQYSTKERKNKQSCHEVLLSLGAKTPRFLITDDAPNFKGHVKSHQLCWIHEIRKYKLTEVYKRIESNTLNLILKRWRYFYHLMNEYLKNPTLEKKERIIKEFESITKIKTLVKPIDLQLERTRKNQKLLLLFLRYPHIPIENNMAERDLRERVIKRKISLQNRSKKGLDAWDLMLSLASTCRKLSISFWDYLNDRIYFKQQIPYLGKVISAR